MKQRICRFAVDSHGAHALPGPLKKGHRIAVALFCCSSKKDDAAKRLGIGMPSRICPLGRVVAEQVGLTFRDADIGEMGDPIAQIDVGRGAGAYPLCRNR